MPYALLQFLFELNIGLTLGFALYWVLLRQAGHYQWTRRFLVFWPLLCMLIAAIQLDYVVWVDAPVVPTLPKVGGAETFIPAPLQVRSLRPQTVLLRVPGWWQLYVAGVLLGIFLFALRLKRLYQLIRMGQACRYADYTLLVHPSYRQIFSFGRYIFAQSDPPLPDMLLAHELVHVRQRHSLDLLWMELLIILNWFNPLIYKYRRHLKEHHEYIADRAVVQQYGLLDYAGLLVAHATGQAVPVLALPFAAFTKKRIIAMKTNTQAPFSRLWYLSIIPVALALVGGLSVHPVEQTRVRQAPSSASEQLAGLVENGPLSLVDGQQTNAMVLPIASTQIEAVSSGFGPRIHPLKKVQDYHRGMDFVAPMGTPVVAAAAGRVVLVEDKPTGYGKRIIIQHENDVRTAYAHLGSMAVSEGVEVEQQQIIGAVGSSGTSIGPHLHFEVREAGKPKDPARFLPDLD